jgi:hypothetical protein
MLKQGFETDLIGHSIYFVASDGHATIIDIRVDDIPMIGDDKGLVELLKLQLSS